MRRHDAWSDLHDAGHRRARTAPAVPRLSLGALAAPQLARRSSHSVRAAAVLDAQHRYGNKRVGRVLSRDATAVRHRPGHPPKLPLKSGQEIDALFDANAFLQQVIASKLGKKYVQKAMKIDSGQAFERAWVAYAKRSFNPVTGKNYTEEEAREYLRTKGVNAFQDEDGGEIHIHKDRGDLGTQLHEGLHLFCHEKWRRMDYNVNEGVTEYFTRKLGADVGVERSDASFLREWTSVTHLVAAVGEDAVAAAYFGGDIAALRRLVDGKAGRKGTFDEWLTLLNNSNFKGANNLMKPLKA